jgi:hypothetical protein
VRVAADECTESELIIDNVKSPSPTPTRVRIAKFDGLTNNQHRPAIECGKYGS